MHVFRIFKTHVLLSVSTFVIIQITAFLPDSRWCHSHIAALIHNYLIFGDVKDVSYYLLVIRMPSLSMSIQVFYYFSGAICYWALDISFCVSCLSTCFDKISQRKQQKEEFVLSHSLRLYSIMIGGGCHNVRVKMQLRLWNACVQLTFFFSVLPES